MEEEQILSGYCRSIDGHRMVTAEREEGLWCVDCDYGCCPYEPVCTIAIQLQQLR